MDQEVVSYPPFGKKWIKRFIKRHLELQTTTGHPIELCRIRETLPETFQQ